MSKSIKQFLVDNQDFLLSQDELRYTTLATLKDGQTYETDCHVKGNVGVRVMIPSLIEATDENGFYKQTRGDIASLQITIIQ